MTTTRAASRTSLPLANPRPHIDEDLLLDCVHCGLCTAACPTYLETGLEADSPRGRIYLMRGVISGSIPLDQIVKEHLDLCLNCRACETACPSGVQYGKLIEPFRVYLTQTGQKTEHLSWVHRLVLRYVFPYRRRNRVVLQPVRWMQQLRIDRALERVGVSKLLPTSLRRLHEMLPRLPSHYGQLPEILPAEGTRRARVGLILGCVADAVFPQTNWNTIRVLQKNGCDVVIPKSQTCCGALHYHLGEEEPARALARKNIEAFGFGNQASGEPLDAVIVNAAGCGAMLKDYGHLLAETPWAEVGERFASRVRDVSEFLCSLGFIKPEHPLKMRATYHDACHLYHAQQIRRPPRELLAAIPELELVPLEESEVCCGAAGSYNLSQPEMAARLGERKAEFIRATGATAVLTANPGCLLQILRHIRRTDPHIWVAHPMDALWASYQGRHAASCPGAAEQV